MSKKLVSAHYIAVMGMLSILAGSAHRNEKCGGMDTLGRSSHPQKHLFYETINILEQ